LNVNKDGPQTKTFFGLDSDELPCKLLTHDVNGEGLPMPRITYTEPDGREVEVAGANGESVMQTAVENGVDGIVGECGGSLMCATCHVYVREDWYESVGEPGGIEETLLEGAAAERHPTSRLGCQIRLDEQLDGLAVQVPDRQY
jgi:2Fe-2S ferredoxin